MNYKPYSSKSFERGFSNKFLIMLRHSIARHAQLSLDLWLGTYERKENSNYSKRVEKKVIQALNESLDYFLTYERIF